MIPQQTKFSNVDIIRKQIDTLKVFNDNVVEVIENEEYCVHFESGGRNFIITVLLGANYPQERPKLVVSPPVQHIWTHPVSGHIEAAPGLQNYSPHSDLGRIVQAIIREYERNPPVISTAGKTTNIPHSSSIHQQQQQSQQLLKAKSQDSSLETSPLDNNSHMAISDDMTLPNLSTLSLEELKQLDNDPEFFDDFIEEMSVVQHLNEELDSMINQVETISRENESKELHLMELKRKLSDDVTTLKNLGEKCDQLNKKYLRKSDEFAPQHIRELLQIAASNADTDCDRHVEQFLKGQIDVQTFLNNYTHSKKISSERKAKEERLGQQLSSGI